MTRRCWAAASTPASQLPESQLAWAFDQCCDTLSALGVSEADIRFNPLSWEKRGVPLAHQLESLRRLKDGDAHACSPNWVVTVKRDDQQVNWRRAAEFALAASASGVVALDVSRSYVVTADKPVPRQAPPLRALEPIARQVRDAGLQVYVHCGWFDTVEDCWAAVDALGAVRLGHGIPIRSDSELLRRIATDKIVIELCPTAAERVGGESLREHPFLQWLDAGARIALGSDHPLELGTNIREEYERVAILCAQSAVRIMQFSADLRPQQHAR